MKYSILTCASFGSSGSGVVTDYLNEYSGIKNLGDYEFRFLQDYDGISTLEDALVNSPHRLNSDIAIQNYIRYIDRQCGTFLNRRYEKFFKGKWKKISHDFLNKIIDIKWPGYWEQYQIMEPNKFQAFLKYQLYPRILRLLAGNKKYIAHYLPKRDMFFAAPSEEYFIKCVREYVDDLCKVIDPNHEYRYIYMDQITPPANISKYERYFDSVKTIVVDRDPRDYYLENVLKYGEGWVPKSVEKFALLYRKHREQASKYSDSSNVLRIKFEDAIFNYNEFENSIINFLDLDKDSHINPKKFFIPEKSIANTRLWQKRDVNIDLIHKIENLLPEYLYDFNSVRPD